MSEQAVAATAEPAASQAQATASAPAPQAPPSQQTATQQPQERFIQVPADQLQDWGGRFGEALKAAKQFRMAEQDGLFELNQELAALGLTPKQYIELLRQSEQQTQGQQPGQQHVADDPDSRPLTAKELKAMLDERDRAIFERQQQEMSERSRQEARAREDAEIVRSLDELGYKMPGQGVDDPRFEMAVAAFDRFLAAAKQADFVEHPGLSRQLNDRKLADHMAKAATPAQMEKAVARFKAALADQSNTAIADFAQRQQTNMPANSTLGSGPGGRQQPPDPSQMTEDQMKAYILQDRHKRLRGQQ
ncbi:MAG TPA: hypothetical protein PK373_02055 [Sedimentisphaerales bacterium]|nr:hypothetical protein [Sedimentisphaerales bacterium]